MYKRQLYNPFELLERMHEIEQAAKREDVYKRQAQISFPEEQKMELRMQSSVLAKSREEELVSYIEKVFCERCPFSLIVEPEYVEASESKVRKNSEIRIMQEASHVIEQASFCLLYTSQDTGGRFSQGAFRCCRSHT